ncbi:MAG: 5-oxoprolinase subunit PxpA [Firmicutes bacterium]|nr:5-oxoprolinase subunit PxpA [Bacillota bacterium]
MFNVDLNCDLGESFGNYVLGSDEKILDYVTSINVACGFHAGDPIVMDETVKMAIKKGVSIGAHPGYPDLLGFGRRNMDISLKEAKAYMIYQIGALKAFVEANGGKLQHVKPHGAMYNKAAKDYNLAKALAEAVYEVDKDIIFMGISNLESVKAAKDIGLKVANEVFADRAYNKDGTLVSRKKEGAVIHDTRKCVSRVLNMVKNKRVKTINGEEIDIYADSICVHGDNEKALEFTKNLKKSLLNEGINVKSLMEIK